LAENSDSEDAEPRSSILCGAVTPLKLSATHLIHRAEQCAADIFARLAPKGLLTPRQYAILVAIEENQGISQTGLVEQTGIDRSTLADIMRRMITRGLVERERTTADARTYAVRLTRNGAKMLRKMRPVAQQVDEEILRVLPEEHQNLFLTILDRLVNHLARPEKTGK
jgi:DNA-binding MarR family transcriptional regulator